MRTLKLYSNSQTRANVLLTLGDNAWSRRRQDIDSSLEFISPTAFAGYKLNHILAYSLCMKKIKGIDVEHFFGNKFAHACTEFIGTSGQMEDFNLRRALKIICSNLEK